MIQNDDDYFQGRSSSIIKKSNYNFKKNIINDLDIDEDNTEELIKQLNEMRNKQKSYDNKEQNNEDIDVFQNEMIMEDNNQKKSDFDEE